MVRLWHLSFTLLLLCKPGPARAEAGAMELSGILGGSVTFPMGVPAEQFKTAAWTVNTANSIATVGAGNPPVLIVSHPSYEGRLTVSAQNYSLQLTGLRVEDTGTYSAQITTATGTVHRQNFTLHVYKRLAESDITVTPVPGSVNTVNGTCSITLNCTVQGAGEDVNCTWNQTEASTVISTGPSIHISHRLGDEGASVTCMARNPVSSSSKSISLKEVCAATTPLYHMTSAPTTTTGTASSAQSGDSGLSAGVIVLIVVVCAGAAVGGVLYQRKRRRDKQTLTPGAPGSAGAEGENQTIYAKVGNFPLGMQNRGPQTTEETTKTIYSTVHLPSQRLQTDDEKLRMEGLGPTETGEKTIYCTASQPSKETSQPTKADDSVAARRTTEYDKII
ncbi:SLAM family member 9-like isoform X2 [Pelodiscus sinensis]|uniref:SLAM family member 9-like isoform X2 n=1 Tax=Pelodiscus sinensis TaxID=13735 RepID=UPI003F6CC237